MRRISENRKANDKTNCFFYLQAITTFKIRTQFVPSNNIRKVFSPGRHILTDLQDNDLLSNNKYV